MSSSTSAGIRTSGFAHRTSFSSAMGHHALANTSLSLFPQNHKPNAQKSHVARPHSASTTVRFSRKRRSIVEALNHQEALEEKTSQPLQQPQFVALQNGSKRRNSLRDEIYRNRMSSSELLGRQHDDFPMQRNSGGSINVSPGINGRRTEFKRQKPTTVANNFLNVDNESSTNNLPPSPRRDTHNDAFKPQQRFQRPVTAPEHMKRRGGGLAHRLNNGGRSFGDVHTTEDSAANSSLPRDTQRDIVESSVSQDGSRHNSINHSKENQRPNAYNQAAQSLPEAVDTSSTIQLKPLRASPGPTSIIESKLRRGVSARAGRGKRSRLTGIAPGDTDSLSSCSTIPLHDTALHRAPDTHRSSSTSSSQSNHQSTDGKRRSANMVRGIGKCLNDFIMLDEIGSGGCGTVYKVKSKINHEIYVAKKVNVRHMSHKQLTETLSEVYLMKEIHHEHIIQFYTSFVENHNLYILMEYAEAGDLHQYYRQQKLRRKYIKESFLWRIMYQTCLALQYLHENKHIIHRDVKALNVFLNSNMVVKLGDLGMSRQVKEEQMLQTNVGTPAFLSPEQIRRKPYDFKVDVWGLGCIMYSLSALRPPFRGDNILELSRSIVQDEVSAIPKHYSLRLRSLIISMLAKNAHSRPSIQEILTSIPEHVREVSGSNGTQRSINHDNFFINGSVGNGSVLSNYLQADSNQTGRSQTPLDNGSRSSSSSHNHPLNHIQVKQPAAAIQKRSALSRKEKVPRTHRKRQQWVS